MPFTSFEYLTPASLDLFISNALREDIGPGDFSSLSAVPEGIHRKAVLKIKDTGVLAGMEMARQIFHQVDPAIQFRPWKKDGDRVMKGEEALEVEGPARSILSAERLVLNCMQRMSGIATKTRYMADLIAHTKAKLLDTRKTTPNSRIMEKWAVSIGGGTNHRFALFDMIMLKDNHVDYAGGITNALSNTVRYLEEKNLPLKIEVETRNLVEVLEVLAHGGADLIMLDNFNLEDMQAAVETIGGRIPTEASGNVTEKTIVPIAETGVDYISVGALTHSYHCLDLSLKAIN